MSTIYISHEDGTLGKHGTALQYKKNRSEAAVESIPIHLVDDVVIMGRGSVSTPAIHLMFENDVPLHFIDSAGHYRGSLTSGRGRGYEIRRLQMNAAFDSGTSLKIARAVVAGKIVNQMKAIKRALSRGIGDAGFDSAAEEACTEMAGLLEALSECQGIDEVRGCEGSAAAAYFGVFGGMLAVASWSFAGRNRRPPKDPVNAMLSFGYTLLLNHVTSAVVKAGLDPCVGFLHPEHRGRPSMALDLMEEFRSQVVDRMVLAVANQMIIKPEDFEPDQDGGIFMTSEARKLFVRCYLERLDETARNESTGEVSTFRQHIFQSAANFASALRSGSEYVPFQALGR